MPSLSRRLVQDLDISPRHAAAAAVVLVLVLTLGLTASLRTSTPVTPDPPRPRTIAPTADHAPPTAALGSPSRRRFPTRESAGASRTAATSSRTGPEGSAVWWFGSVGVALALAVVGWGSVAARRFLPRGASGPVPMRVVGRTSLSPKHTVYLLDVGGRVLILGAGPQGAPSLLGEMTDPAAVAPPPRFDLRLGDES